MAEESKFLEGISEVRELLNVPLDSENFSSHGTINQLNAIRRASVVLLVSHFEGYLKSLAEDYIDVVGGGHLPSSKIPMGIRELHTLPKFEEIVSCADDRQRTALLKKISSVTVLWNDTAKPSAGTLQADVLARRVTSATSDCIDALFELMGSRQKVCDGEIDVQMFEDQVTSLNIRYSLSDLVGCRNAIAHGDPSRKPTSEDIDRYVSFLTAFTARLERKLGQLVQPLAAVSA